MRFSQVLVGHAFMIGTVRCIKETAYSYSHFACGMRFYAVVGNIDFLVGEIPW